jgi:hypothetical protein
LQGEIKQARTEGCCLIRSPRGSECNGNGGSGGIIVAARQSLAASYSSVGAVRPKDQFASIFQQPIVVQEHDFQLNFLAEKSVHC